MRIKTNFKSLLLSAMLLAASVMSFAQPANDLPCNAIFLPVDGITYYYDNLLATADLGEVVPPAGTSGAGSCVSTDGWCGVDLVADATVWFTFQAPASGKVIISTCDALTVIDGQIAVYSATLCSDYSTFTLRGANDDDPTGCNAGSGYEPVLYLDGLTPGNLYYLQVDGYQGDDGLFGVSITQGFESANNNICNAQSLTLGLSTTCSSNAFDNAELGEPVGSLWAGSDGVQNSVWYSFVAPASGKVYMSTDFAGTSFDTQLGVYKSSDNTCNGTLTEVGSDDDSGPGYFVTSELALTCLRPGNTYFVQVDGYGGLFGNFCLLVNDTATTTGLTPLITATSSIVCDGEPFTVISTATGGTTGLGGTYSGSNATQVAVPDNSITGASTSVAISGSNNVVTPSSVVVVNLNITHTFNGDLDVYLVGPGNCGALELTTDNGGTTDNYTNTVLSTSGVTLVTSGTGPFTGTYRPEGTITTPPAANIYTSLPVTAINGCPIDGSWTLRVFDDLGGDNGTLDNWSLAITESYYKHTISGNGTIQTSVSGANNSTATATITNSPVGFNSYISTISDAAGCIQTDTVEVKVFDTPSILSVSNSCSLGNNGTITITASTIDNGNFTAPADLGVVEYSFDGGNTWGTNNVASGFAAGTHSIAIRNSANPNCITSGFTTIQGAPALLVTNNSPVCEGTGVTVSGSAAGGSQFTFSGNAASGLAISDNNTTGISSSVNIFGTGSISASSIVSVTLNITHTFDGDVDAYLVGPGNCGTLELTTDNGGASDNYVNTVLNTAAATVITSGSAPFTGTFRPEGTITGTNTNAYGLPTSAINGCPVSGEWKLRVFDDAGGDLGTLNNWSVSLTNNGDFTHALTGVGSIGAVTYSGANNSNGSFDVTNIPFGNHEFIYNVTSASGCVKVDTFDVKVFDTPAITNTVTTCSSGSNGSITVTASTINNANFTGIDIGVVEYSFDGSNNWTTNNTATGLAQGSYNLYVRNSANITCQSGPLTVSLSGGFVANAGPDTSVCPGSQVSLVATGGTDYLWSTNETTASIIVAPTQTTVYSVTVSDNTGCSDIQTVTVTTFTSPVPALGADIIICTGSSATLTASGGGDYLWSTTEITASITVSPVGTTVYAVTVTDANECTATDDITVDVSPLVTAGLNSNSPVCENGSLTFTSLAGGGTLAGQQTYSGSVTANVNIPDGSVTGATSVINITGASVINNASTVAVTLNINHTWAQDIEAYLVGPNGCGTLELTTDNGGGGDNYVNTVLITSSPNIIGSVGFNTPPFTGTFAPEGTIAGINTNVYGLPTNGIDGCPVDGNWTLRVFDDDAIVAGTLLNWSLSVTADNVYGHGLSGTGTVSNTVYTGTQLETAQFTVTSLTPGIHEFINTVTDAFGCEGKDTVEVKVFDVPAFVSATGTCSDGANGEITVTASIDNANFTGNDIGVVEYSYDGGNTWTTSNTATGLAPATYQIYLRNSASTSCSAGPFSVEVFGAPVLAASNTGPVCEGTDITFSSTASGGSPNLNFSGSAVSGQTVTDDDINGISSNLTINGTGNISATSTVSVTLNITHTFDSDLDAYLVGPGNCGTLELFTGVGSAGDNFTNTVLSTAAANVIGSTGNNTAPFTGTYAPEGTIAGTPAIASYSLPVTAIDGCPVNGTWTLHVFDGASGDVGMLQDWNLNITNPVGYTHLVTGPGTLGSVVYTGQDNEDASVTVTDAPIGSSDYTVTVTDARGCSSSITTTTKVYDLPNIISVTGGCTGVITVTADPIDNANFTGNDIGVMEYSFDGGNTWTTNNVATGLPSGSYDVYVRNSASVSCQAGPQSVTVYQKPVVTLPDPNICIGGSATLDAGQFDSYSWSTGETTQTISATTTDDYIVVVTDANGCTATDTASVSAVASLPVIIDDSEFCVGSSLTLNAGNPGANYTWSTGETTQTITVSTGGLYSVTVSDNSGCTGTDNGTITENPLPTIGLVDRLICGGSVTIDAGNGGSDFAWSTGETTQSISVSVAATYQVTVTDGNGCVAADTVDIIASTALIVTLPAVVEICSGDITTLDAGNPGSTYLWSTTETTQTIDVSTANTYSVTVSSAGGCTGTASSDVIVNALPIADAGQAPPICGGGIVTLTASGGITYEWSDGATTQSTDVGPVQNTTYFVTVTDGNGCSASDSVEVSVFAAIVVTVSNDTTVCATSPVDLTANGGVDYEWNTGATTATTTVSPVNPTTYVVTVTDANGCSATGTVNVSTNALPNANAGSDVGLCEGGVLTIYGSGGGAYEWSTGVTTASLTVSPTTTSIYTLTVTDNNGCTDVDLVTVNVNPLPVVSLSFSQTAFCTIDPSITATVAPPFGTLSGSGVAGLILDPWDAGVGEHLIIYTYIDANSCENSASVAISVETCPGIDELVKALEAAQVYPNPFSNEINVKFTAAANDEITVRMVDVLGRVIVNDKVDVRMGENTFTLTTGNELASGMYYIHLIKANKTVSFKLSRFQ